MMKKWIALLLAALLIISVLPIAALASEEGEQAEATAEQTTDETKKDTEEDTEEDTKEETTAETAEETTENNEVSVLGEEGEKTPKATKIDVSVSDASSSSEFYIKGEDVLFVVTLTDKDGNAVAGKEITVGSKTGTTGADGKAKIHYTVYGTKALEEVEVAFKGDDDYSAQTDTKYLPVGIPVTKVAITITQPKVGAKPVDPKVTVTPTSAKYVVDFEKWLESEDGVGTDSMSESTYLAGMHYYAPVGVVLEDPAEGDVPLDTGSSVASGDAPGYFFDKSTVYTVNGKAASPVEGRVYSDEAWVSYHYELPYTITSGSGSKWAKTSTASLPFTCDGKSAKLAGVKIDGKLIDSGSYTKTGTATTTVTLKNAYLKTLTNGTHKITFVYTVKASSTINSTVKATSDGDSTKDSNTVTFSITSTATTGDNSMTGMWMALAVTSAFAMAAVTVLGKKRRAH